MEELIFATCILDDDTARKALLLAESIRTFTGRFSGCPVQAYCPVDLDNISNAIRKDLRDLGVEVHPYSLTENAQRFPFAPKTFAAAAAEENAQGRGRVLVWMDSGSLFFKEPEVLALEEGIFLGYRPVDHTLIGSLYADVISPFWAEVYQACGVPAERIFPMRTSQDGNRLRPYFNAGMLAVRPEGSLLRAWAKAFSRLYRQSFFEGYYQKDPIYAIFVHQVILSAVVLAACRPQELAELPHLVNYPLHMHREYPLERRPSRINDLVSCRYEAVFQDPSWGEWLPVDEPLKGWLEERFIRS